MAFKNLFKRSAQLGLKTQQNKYGSVWLERKIPKEPQLLYFGTDYIEQFKY